MQPLTCCEGQSLSASKCDFQKSPVYSPHQELVVRRRSIYIIRTLGGCEHQILNLDTGTFGLAFFSVKRQIWRPPRQSDYFKDIRVQLTRTPGRWWGSLLPVDAQDLEQILIEPPSALLPHWCLFSLCPLKWAKNNLPRCRGHECEGTPCPLLESTCSNYCSPTSSHGSCAGMAQDDMTKWCKPERRQIHRPALGWGWVGCSSQG